MRFLVVGAGSWGTAFSRVLLDRGHEVVLACHTRGQAAAIAETGRNPRYLTQVDLSGATAVELAEAPADVDVIVVAVPSRAFAAVAAALPGEAPVLSLTKGLDPATGARLSTCVDDRSVAVLSGPNMAEEVLAGLPAVSVIAEAPLLSVVPPENPTAASALLMVNVPPPKISDDVGSVVPVRVMPPLFKVVAPV